MSYDQNGGIVGLENIDVKESEFIDGIEFKADEKLSSVKVFAINIENSTSSLCRAETAEQKKGAYRPLFAIFFT